MRKGKGSQVVFYFESPFLGKGSRVQFMTLPPCFTSLVKAQLLEFPPQFPPPFPPPLPPPLSPADHVPRVHEQDGLLSFFLFG